MKSLLSVIGFIAVMQMSATATASVSAHTRMAAIETVLYVNDPFLPSGPLDPRRHEQRENPGSEGNAIYRSVARLDRVCSSSFINTSDDDSAPAYLLSAGHCVQELNALSDNHVVLDQAVSLTAEFNMFQDIPEENRIPVQVVQIAYASMKGMDIALLKTDQTIGDLKAKNLQPYPLSRRIPARGEPIIIAGMPNGGWLALSRCEANSRVNLLESIWHFNGFLQTPCTTIGGMSGGPTFTADADGRPVELVAELSTGKDERLWLGTPCYIGNPCVITEQGLIPAQNQSFVVPVAGIQDCFTAQGLFQSSLAHCPLPKATGLTIDDRPVEITGINATPESQKWNFSPQSPFAGLKVKMIKVTSTAQTCHSMTDYKPVALPGFDPRQEQIPVQEEGIYHYCLLPLDSPTAADADVIRVKVDNTGSTTRPLVQVIPGANDTVRIFFSFILEENAVHYYAFGPLDTFNCPEAGTADYKPTGETTFVAVPYSRVKVCSYLGDPALNKGVVYEVDYPPEGA
jgi:hypothetical protein